MKLIIEKYLAKRIIMFIGFTLLTVVGIEFLFSLIDQMDDFDKGRYGLLEALKYVTFTMPRRIYEYFPIAVLFGGLLGLGQMASNNELVVMRAVSFSIQRIFMVVMKVALGLMIFAIILGEFIAPQAELYAQKERAIAQNEGRAVDIGEGAWVRHGNWFIFIRDVVSSTQLREIIAYQFDHNYELVKVQKIDRAKFDDGIWYFENVTSNDISQQGVTSKKFKATFDGDWIDPDVLDVLAVKPETLSTPGLSSYIEYLNDNQLESGPFELAFWNKVFQPLATFVMMFLAIPFIFGPLRGTTVGTKILIGGLMGFTFFILNQIFGPVSLIYDFPPVIAASLPSVLFFMIGVYMLRKVY